MKIATPQTDIEAFLHYEINIEIFEDFESNEFEDISTLEFFNLLYSEYEFYYNNSEKYLTIKEHFENLIFVQPLFENHKLYHDFFYWLTEIIQLEFETNGTNKIEQRTYKILENIYIQTKYPQGTAEKLDTFENKPIWDFQETKKALSKIENVKEKINYLIEQTTNFKQCDENWATTWGEVSFDEKCDLEIKKLKSLLELEPQQNTAPIISNSLKWHGSPLQLSELIKPLYDLKLISPELKQKEVFEKLRLFFELENFNENDKIKEIKERKEGTTFLHLLENSWNNHKNNKK
jgi:hypothetical protein